MKSTILIFTVSILHLETIQACFNKVSLVPNYNNCSSYYAKGDNGSTCLGICPKGTYYDCVSQKCGNIIWTSCCPNDLVLPRKLKPKLPCKINGVIIKTNYVSTQYYICENFQFIEKNITFISFYNTHYSGIYNSSKCGLFFSLLNSDKSSFVTMREIWLLLFQILNQIDTKTTTTRMPVTSTTDLIEKPRMSCTFHGETFPKADDCTSYYICKFGILLLRRCYLGFKWNCFHKACKPLETFTPCCEDDPNAYTNRNWCLIKGKKVPNPFDDRKYFECNGTKIMDKICPSGTKYNKINYCCI